MHILSILLTITLSIFAITSSAHATEVIAVIDKHEQQVHIFRDDAEIYTWLVSTGRKGGWTPSGTFGVQSMDATHRSKKYHNAPMPWSVFFDGNRATHGTTYVDRLGTPQSHGCVRLDPDNARIFFELIQEVGMQNVTIIVQD